MSPERAASSTAEQAVVTDRYFRFARVHEGSGLEAAFRIRYQVYCVERRFLPEADYPEQAETDEFDGDSVHAVATHLSGEPAGTARLVLSSRRGFPAARHCVFDEPFGYLAETGHPALAHVAEVSRLAISKSFRRRRYDGLYGAPPRTDPSIGPDQVVVPFAPPRNSPEIIIGLWRVLYQESKRCDIRHWILAMERGLLLLVKRMGFDCVPVGPEVDYYGPVRPYIVSLEALEQRLVHRFPQTLLYLTRGLERQRLPSCLRSEIDSGIQGAGQ
jgi:N-acyl amino acid synthase of PEP-CTERM/exosortase system